MGVVVRIEDNKKKKNSKLRFWILNYVLQKKSSPNDAEKYLRNKVPSQLWYQVQKEAKERYGV